MSILRCLCLAVITGTLILGPGAGHAERFLGRALEITDARRDTNQPAPVVVTMHGFLGNGANMRKKTGLDGVARRHGFIAVYPNGRARRWNDGRSPSARVDDVGYLTKLIAALIADGRADPARIYLAGHSNGGGMAMRMACARPDLVAGIAVVATKVALNFQCRDGAPVPAIVFHGTQDPISPHGGRAADSRLGGALSSAQSIKLWAARNRCRGAPSRQTIDKKQDGTSVDLFRYRGCAAPFTYVELVGHGHDWPSTRGRASRLQGAASKEIDATALMWQFFDAQR